MNSSYWVLHHVAGGRRLKATVRCEDWHFLQQVQSQRDTALVALLHSGQWWVHLAGLEVDGSWVRGHHESWQPDNGLLKTLFLHRGPRGEASSSRFQAEMTPSFLIWQPWLISGWMNRARVWFFFFFLSIRHVMGWFLLNRVAGRVLPSSKCVNYSQWENAMNWVDH